MKRFNIVQNGYDVNEVNRFVDIVIKRLETMNNENMALKKENANLKGQLEKKSNTEMSEEKFSQAIIAIQETSDKMKELAKAESKMIIEDAKRNANSIVHEALVTAEKTENEANLLRKNINVYKNRVTSLIKAQLEIADDLDKIDLK
jgi:cell division initiation protein